jgi:hypothetical protein
MFNKLNELFSALEKEFPYSSMGKDFKGGHSITRDNIGVIVVSVWWNGSVYPIGVEPNDFEDINKFIIEIRRLITNWKKSG